MHPESGSALLIRLRMWKPSMEDHLMKTNRWLNLVQRLQRTRWIPSLRFDSSPQAFRLRLILLPLVLVAVSIAIVSLSLLGTIEQSADQIQQLSSRAIEKQAEDYMLDLTVSSARQFDRFLGQILNQARSLAYYVAS